MDLPRGWKLVAGTAALAGIGVGSYAAADEPGEIRRNDPAPAIEVSMAAASSEPVVAQADDASPESADSPFASVEESADSPFDSADDGADPSPESVDSPDASVEDSIDTPDDAEAALAVDDAPADEVAADVESPSSVDSPAEVESPASVDSPADDGAADDDSVNSPDDVDSPDSED
jgi:hypothetical protein